MVATVTGLDHGLTDDRRSHSIRATAGQLITAEDHYAEGGLGDAVLEAVDRADRSAPRA